MIQKSSALAISIDARVVILKVSGIHSDGHWSNSCYSFEKCFFIRGDVYEIGDAGNNFGRVVFAAAVFAYNEIQKLLLK